MILSRKIRVKRTKNVEVPRRILGLIPCASEEANPGAPRIAFRRAGTRKKIRLPKRSRGESCSADEREVISEDPLFTGDGKDPH